MSDDQAWRQAQELAQAGKEDKTFGQAQDELLAKIIDQKQLVLNAFYAMFVKKTADELPDSEVNVLGWIHGQWRIMYLGLYGSWWSHYEDYWHQSEVKYWLPLPTFNPEGEG